MKILKRCWFSLNIAFSMYSRLPAAQCGWTEENMKYVMCFFPWIGAVIGALCLGWNCLTEFLGMRSALRAAVMAAIPVLVTGGIHLDGFLDTMDAMSSWRPREKRLEILKDSHAGAFAILSCTVYFVLLYGALDSVRGDMTPVFACGFVISRALSGFSVVTFPKVSANGTVAGFAKSAETRTIRAVCIGYVIAAGILMLWMNFRYGAAMLIGAAVSFLWYYHLSMKYFGGINGDLAGCFLSVCELAMPLSLAGAALLPG